MSHAPSPLHIAYLTGEYPAVSHTFILREIEGLRARGVEVSTCSIRRTDASHHRGTAEKDAASSTFYVLAEARKPAALLGAVALGAGRPARFFKALVLAWQTRAPGLRALVYQIFYLLEALILVRHLEARGVTHLHNHFANSSCTVALLASTLSDIPFSFTMHGPAIFFEPRRWRIDEKMARASFVACISHFCRSQGMIFSSPAHWDKLRIVHCAVTPEIYGTQPDLQVNKRILFVGRLAAVKGVRILLEAFAKTRQTHPDAELVLVGDGDERADIEAHARSLGCADAVQFKGYLSQPEVAAELDRADIFALPSFAEGVPVVLMEAMASRLSVVATRIAGIPELVEDGVTGRIVPPGDVDAFTNALSALLDDPQKRREMGEAGRIKVVEEYAIASEVAWLESLLRGTAPHRALRPEQAPAKTGKTAD